MVYDIHILGLVIFNFCKLLKQQSMFDELEIHICSMECQDTYLIALKKHDLMSERIYQVYTRYILGIYYTYTMQMSLASLCNCPHSFGSLSPKLPSDLLSFWPILLTCGTALPTERPRTLGWGRPKFHNQVLIS